MADPTLDASAKGANSNSYVTRAEATSYFDERLSITDWTSASNADKDRALIMATNRLEQEDWDGSPTDGDQRLKWPRNGTFDMDGFSYDADEVPRHVKEATYELALALTIGDLELKDTGLEGFKDVGVGPLKVVPRASRKAGSLPQQVVRLVSHLRIGASELNVPVVRS